jgi:hypothetical protein
MPTVAAITCLVAEPFAKCSRNAHSAIGSLKQKGLATVGDSILQQEAHCKTVDQLRDQREESGRNTHDALRAFPRLWKRIAKPCMFLERRCESIRVITARQLHEIAWI